MKFNYKKNAPIKVRFVCFGGFLEGDKLHRVAIKGEGVLVGAD